MLEWIRRYFESKKIKKYKLILELVPLIDKEISANLNIINSLLKTHICKMTSVRISINNKRECSSFSYDSIFYEVIDAYITFTPKPEIELNEYKINSLLHDIKFLHDTIRILNEAVRYHAKDGIKIDFKQHTQANYDESPYYQYEWIDYKIRTCDLKL